MEREKKSKHFIHQPEFPGGPKELTKFIYQHLRYPSDALKAGVEGTVIVEYDIDFKGNVIDTRVLQGIGHGCDEEASRVVRLLKFSVGRNRGVRVLFHKKANIRFKLPQQTRPKQPAVNQPGSTQVQYVYTTHTPQKDTEQPEQKPATTTYSYTIQLNKKN
ncbi:MAG: energy transducer TonB [Bacteroidetes bacterium]|nr:MAG: energy transducer TonB [Bacteroidota bacterium]